MTTTPTLEYGRAMTRRRRWARRGIVVLVLLILVGYPSWRWGAKARQVIPLLYWQSRCLNYTPAKDQVAYEEDPTAAAKLLNASPQYTVYPLNRSQGKDPAKATNAAAYVPKCWTKFGGYAGPSFGPWPGAPYGALAFLHERASPAGNRRLVIVRFFPETNTYNPYFIAGFNYEAQAIVPGTMTKPPAAIRRGYGLDVISTWPQVAPKVRMYSGQSDPANDAHFTIRYEMWGKSDTLDGYLDDKDEVNLKPRKQPLDKQWDATAAN